jgi:hypothetical protein
MGLFSAIGDIFTGNDKLKKAGKAGAKAYKKSEATRKTQLADANALHTAQQNALATANTQATGALTTAGNQSQNALRNASTQQQNVLQQEMARQQGLRQPGIDYAQGGYGLMQGAFGEEGADDFMARYENSPLYRAMTQPAMDEATAQLERMGAARGGLNSGGLVRDVMDRTSMLGGRGMMDYMGLLQNRLNYGQGVINNAGDAYGNISGMRSSAYGDTGARSASAYQNTGNALAGNYGDFAGRGLANDQLLSANRNTAYGGISDAQIGKGAAKSAAYTGMANNQAGFWNGAMNMAGNMFGGPLAGAANSWLGKQPWNTTG